VSSRHPNLRLALSITDALRHSQTRLTRRVWFHENRQFERKANGICISQSNVAEKSAQVALIGKIYERATGAITYTGPEDDDTRPAILLAIHCLVFITAVDQNKDSFPIHELLSPIAHNDGIKAYGFPPRNDTKYQFLRCLLQLPWASRAWIFQESVMNMNISRFPWSSKTSAEPAEPFVGMVKFRYFKVATPCEWLSE
jgi:hypothetical protein